MCSKANKMYLTNKCCLINTAVKKVEIFTM